MSHAVVGLLDKESAARTEALWARLEERHGVKAIRLVPFPHVSFHVAAGYDLDAVIEAMKNLATEIRQTPFACDGFGFFTGPAPMFPVLFRPVTRTAELSELRTRVWAACQPLSLDSSEYYSDSAWKPHITIASRDLDASKLSRVVEDLASEPVEGWTGMIDRLGLIVDQGKHDLMHETQLN